MRSFCSSCRSPFRLSATPTPETAPGKTSRTITASADTVGCPPPSPHTTPPPLLSPDPTDSARHPVFESVQVLLAEQAELQNVLADPTLHTDPVRAKKV